MTLQGNVQDLQTRPLLDLSAFQWCFFGLVVSPHMQALLAIRHAPSLEDRTPRQKCTLLRQVSMTRTWVKHDCLPVLSAGLPQRCPKPNQTNYKKTALLLDL